MDVRAFCSQSRVMIVAGKGGVGKTTMVAALAHLAAGAGLSVLVIELEGRTGVSTAFGGTGVLGYAGEVLHAAGATDLGGGDVDESTVIPPGTVHSIENVGPTVMVTLFWASEVFDPARPDAYYVPVLQIGEGS